ncbi:hypothetical protein Ahy_A03g011160 isoform B [Arachis hypogaea]|uniref:Transposase MuDR plant domain-containing protein n=1 Tax=Arachis hypogaea TaxID=3818 RepID=A0A445DPX9_ARAHY|nr:hypothetical protein Ahy_A03g011160 isoform B [Arachis hypogaea]
MVSARDSEFVEGFRLQGMCKVMLGLKELKSDGNATKMARALVMDYVKHGVVFAVDGYKECNGVKITSIDLDYVPYEGKDSGLIKEKVDVESEPSTEEDRFEDNTDDGEHENYFGFDVEDGVDGGESNVFDGFNARFIKKGLQRRLPRIITLLERRMNKLQTFLMYNGVEMCREYEFKVGLEFKSLFQFKDAIKELFLLNGKDIRYKKNDKLRCRVICNGQKKV